jgi:putative FmdB family regulatory protein
VPTYQYLCTKCGEQLEAVQKFTDDPLTECPACRGRLRKVFNSVGIVFKGSGFYRTDSRRAGESHASLDAAAKSEPKSADSKSVSAAKSESSDAAAASSSPTSTGSTAKASSSASTGSAAKAASA